jgi:hypothetical protein
MSFGMLWLLDKNADCLAEKIKRAAAYHLKKYGAYPNMCMLHPIMGLATVEGIVVQSDRTILPGNLWIGMKDAKEKEEKA